MPGLRNRRLADALAERPLEEAPPPEEQPMQIRNLDEEEARRKATEPQEVPLVHESYMDPIHIPEAPTETPHLPDWVVKENAYQEGLRREQLKSTALHLWKIYQTLRGRK